MAGDLLALLLRTADYEAAVILLEDVLQGRLLRTRGLWEVGSAEGPASPALGAIVDVGAAIVHMLTTAGFTLPDAAALISAAIAETHAGVLSDLDADRGRGILGRYQSMYEAVNDPFITTPQGSRPARVAVVAGLLPRAVVRLKMLEADAVPAMALVVHQMRATSATGDTPSWDALTPVLRCVPFRSDAASMIEVALAEIGARTLPTVTGEQLDAIRQELVQLAGVAWSPDPDRSEDDAHSIGPTEQDARGFTILPSIRRYMTLETIVHSGRAAASGGVPPEHLTGDEAALLARARQVVVNADFNLWVGSIDRAAAGGLTAASDRAAASDLAALAQFVAALDESEQTALGDALAGSVPTFEVAGDDRLSAAWLAHLDHFTRSEGMGGQARSRIATPSFIAAAKHMAMMATNRPLEPELIDRLTHDAQLVTLTAGAVRGLLDPMSDESKPMQPDQRLKLLTSVWSHIHQSASDAPAGMIHPLAISLTLPASRVVGALVAGQLMAPHDGDDLEGETVFAAATGSPVAGCIGESLASAMSANPTIVLSAVSRLFQCAGDVLVAEWRKTALRRVAGLAGPVVEAARRLLGKGELRNNLEARGLLEALTGQVNSATRPQHENTAEGFGGVA